MKTIFRTLLVIISLLLLYFSGVNLYRHYTWSFLDSYLGSAGKISLPAALVTLVGFIFLFFDKKPLEERLHGIVTSIVESKLWPIVASMAALIIFILTLWINETWRPVAWEKFIDKSFANGEQDRFMLAHKDVEKAAEANSEAGTAFVLALSVFERRSAINQELAQMSSKAASDLAFKMDNSKATHPAAAVLLEYATAEANSLAGQLEENHTHNSGSRHFADARGKFGVFETRSSIWITPRWRMNAQLLIANTHYYERVYRLAVDQFKAIRAKGATAPDTIFANIVAALCKDKRYDEAIDVGREGVVALASSAQSKPTAFCSLVGNLMMAFLAKGDSKRAIEEYERHMTECSMLPDDGLVVIYCLTLLLGNDSEAFEDYVVSAKQIPERERDLLIGLYLLQQNKVSDAAPRLRRYVNYPEDLGFSNHRLHLALEREFGSGGLDEISQLTALISRLEPAVPHVPTP